MILKPAVPPAEIQTRSCSLGTVSMRAVLHSITLTSPARHAKVKLSQFCTMTSLLGDAPFLEMTAPQLWEKYHHWTYRRSLMVARSHYVYMYVYRYVCIHSLTLLSKYFRVPPMRWIFCPVLGTRPEVANWKPLGCIWSKTCLFGPLNGTVFQNF